MPATNNFLPFATDGGANVQSQSAYAAAATTGTGFQTGIADSSKLNKVWRQASVIASQLAQLICDFTGLDMLDNADTATLLATMKKGLGRGIVSVATQTNDYPVPVGVTQVPVDTTGGDVLITIDPALGTAEAVLEVFVYKTNAGGGIVNISNGSTIVGNLVNQNDGFGGAGAMLVRANGTSLVFLGQP